MIKHSPKINIIIDTREQTPFSFPEWLCNTTRGTLKTGDYALEDDLLFAIERKSIQDFASTITRDWERFTKEMVRMEVFVSKVIVIEGDLKNFCFYMENNKMKFPEYNNQSITPQFILSRIGELLLKNIHCVFASNKILASAVTYHTLRKRKNELEIKQWMTEEQYKQKSKK